MNKEQRLFLRIAAISGIIAVTLSVLYHSGVPFVLLCEKYSLIFTKHLCGSILLGVTLVYMGVFCIPRMEMNKASICLCAVTLWQNIPDMPHIANPFITGSVLATGYYFMCAINRLRHTEQPNEATLDKL